MSRAHPAQPATGPRPARPLPGLAPTPVRQRRELGPGARLRHVQCRTGCFGQVQLDGPVLQALEVLVKGLVTVGTAEVTSSVDCSNNKRATGRHGLSRCT